MKILVADDHETNRRLLAAILQAEGHDVIEAKDGGEAVAILNGPNCPPVGLIDWQMPVMVGTDVCRNARVGPNGAQLFLILVTARDTAQDVVAGLDAGANDYITKPFDHTELLARVRVGAQMVELQQSLARRVRELEEALAQVKQLKGLLPICGYCKRIRDDHDYWEQVEHYIARHTEVNFSHGVCPECYDHHLRPDLERLLIASGRSLDEELSSSLPEARRAAPKVSPS